MLDQLPDLALMMGHLKEIRLDIPAITDHDTNGRGVRADSGDTARGRRDSEEQRRTSSRRNTSHLKAVPELAALRHELSVAAADSAAQMPKTFTFSKDELEQRGRRLLVELGQPEKYLGLTMVLLGNAFWRRQFLATPFARRLLLLPATLKHSAGCAGGYGEFGLQEECCGACAIADYRGRAEELGYKVLAAEGSPVVLKYILEGQIDAILGIADLNDLERAFDNVLLAGVASYAIPLHSENGQNAVLDQSWVGDVLEGYESLEAPLTFTYLPLMRAANQLFGRHFERLLPRVRSATPDQAASPLGRTEDIAYDWLAKGGKRFRPFITLAAYQARQMSAGPGRAGQPDGPEFSDAVARVAMAIEAFHKASLVHDDIQDDDLFRYGRETLHRAHGMGPAINIGDYLIGLGYRLVNSCREDLGADVAADIVQSMSSAHIKLCDGQGAEMSWQHSPDWSIRPLDALQIYALKTSPAFEAALYAGLRLAGDAGPYAEMIPQFARHLGVGFQVLNDLKDWQGDDHNKLVAGQDALALRPTVLLAFALEAASDEQRVEIRQILEDVGDDAQRVRRLRQIFSDCQAFVRAEAIVDKSRERAEALADNVSPEPLRRLLNFLIDTVLAPESRPRELQEADSSPPVAPSLTTR